MPINLTAKTKPTHREVELPSMGYPYRHAFPEGKVLVQAFNWESERLLFKTPFEGLKKMSLRERQVLDQIIVNKPKDFDVGDLLGGDSFYLMVVAKALSYGNESVFEVMCPECESVEKINVLMPDHLPMNKYFSEFEGTLTLTTEGGYDIEYRFLSLKEDAEADRMAADRVAKGAVGSESREIDYERNRLGMQIVSINGKKVDSMEEVREFLTSNLSLLDKDELQNAIGSTAPGLSSVIPVDCPECHNKYMKDLPLTAEFFRIKSRRSLPVLPAGVRINVLGQKDGGEFITRAGKSGVPGVSQPIQQGDRTSSESGEAKP